MKICYRPQKFQPHVASMLFTADQILTEYMADGYQMTVRMLYYQLVARDIIPNNHQSYKRLADWLNNGRLAGLIDWSHLVDITRNLKGLNHWNDPAQILANSAKGFRVDMWEDQATYVEIWVEKDALQGVIARAADEFDVPYFSCRGYTSQSEVRSAAMRLVRELQAEKDVLIIHLGDHDPSGIDMSRDIEDRLRMFCDMHYDGDHTIEVDRIALNRDQVDHYKPPPNPAKMTDSRFKGYIAEHGRSSWELDALPPDILNGLITERVKPIIDMDAWDAAEERIKAGRRELASAAEHWPIVAEIAELDTWDGVDAFVDTELDFQQQFPERAGLIRKLDDRGEWGPLEVLMEEDPGLIHDVSNAHEKIRQFIDDPEAFYPPEEGDDPEDLKWL